VAYAGATEVYSEEFTPVLAYFHALANEHNVPVFAPIHTVGDVLSTWINDAVLMVRPNDPASFVYVRRFQGVRTINLLTHEEVPFTREEAVFDRMQKAVWAEAPKTFHAAFYRSSKGYRDERSGFFTAEVEASSVEDAKRQIKDLHDNFVSFFFYVRTEGHRDLTADEKANLSEARMGEQAYEGHTRYNYPENDPRMRYQF
jgi:hypothetical protein